MLQCAGSISDLSKRIQKKKRIQVPSRLPERPSWWFYALVSRNTWSTDIIDRREARDRTYYEANSFIFLFFILTKLYEIYDEHCALENLLFRL
jgi:hypothetical protein